MLTIWGRKTSSNVQALMWAVGELGLAYERHDVGHRYGGNDTPEFLAMNPNGTVPVLRDGEGEFLWETGAVLRYLATRYAGSAFWPEDVLKRSHVDKWAEWSKLNVAQMFTGPVFRLVVRTAPEKRDPDAITAALGELGRYLDIAEKQLEAYAFIAGDDFTLADIQFGHVLYRYFDIDIARADRPALRRYYETLEGRQPYREHVMVSYEELRVI